MGKVADARRETPTMRAPNTLRRAAQPLVCLHVNPLRALRFDPLRVARSRPKGVLPIDIGALAT